MDKRLLNVTLLGLAFMMVFISFQTQGNMQEAVIDSIKKEDPNFHGSGYISLAIVYCVFATMNWFTPSFLSFIGPKLTMIAGSITYSLFVASFLWPQTWLLYLMSVSMGAGAALIWAGQGNYLTLMSDETTIGRNTGVFFALMSLSTVVGNIFVLFQFRGHTVIDSHTRTIVYSALTAVSGVGLVLLLLLPNTGAGIGRKDEVSSPTEELIKSWKLFKTKDMMLLSVTFFYIGLEQSFFGGVYGACLNFTLRFPDPKMLLGLSAIFAGIGNILGGVIFGMVGTKTIKYGRDPIVLLGFFFQMCAFFLIFMNVPSAAPLGDTYDPVYFSMGEPSAEVAVLCSFLLALGNSCFVTQIYAVLGTVHAHNSGPAFSLFRFTSSLSAALCFFYSKVLNLHHHIIILVLFGTAGTLTFFVVEWGTHRKRNARTVSYANDEDKSINTPESVNRN